MAEFDRLINGSAMWDGEIAGKLSVGVYSPHLKRKLAIAPVNAEMADSGAALIAAFDNDHKRAEVTSLPFC